MIGELISRTGELSAGFAINVAITVLAMILGTALGAVLGLMRFAGGPLGRIAGLLSRLCRSLPSFAFLLYLAFVLPVTIEAEGAVYLFPLWLKAVLALAVPVAGFAADRVLIFRQQLADGEAGADLKFLAAWLDQTSFVLMASATASVIGADEILARANRIAASLPEPGFTMLTYGYAALWFIAAGLLLNFAATRIDRGSRRARDRIVRHNRRRRRREFQVRKCEAAAGPPVAPATK